MNLGKLLLLSSSRSLSVYKMGRFEDIISEYQVWSHTDVSLNPSCHLLAVLPWASRLTSLSLLLYKMS